jgi:hypothetical protein
VVHRIAVSIDGHTPIRLTPDEASDLAEALWRVGEHQNARGGIVLSLALLDAKKGGPVVAAQPLSTRGSRRRQRRQFQMSRG